MIHEHIGQCAAGLGKIVEASKVSKTLGLHSEPFLVQERMEIKRNSEPSVTPLAIRGRQRRCFHYWPILCLIYNNITDSSLIVVYHQLGPPFGGLFLSYGGHNSPEVCEKSVVTAPNLTEADIRLFWYIVSSLTDQNLVLF